MITKGHDRGWKLAKHLNAQLIEIRDRVDTLIHAGWKRVHIVTDHGWLLLPGDLPKIDLPSALADSKWGRCASLKPGASSNERLYPWYWNSNQYFALADGISCFKKGEEYAHGGLSLQECLVLDLTVSPTSKTQSKHSITLTDIVWKGLRCTVAVDGDYNDLMFDIRHHAGDPETSIIVSLKPIKDNGTASVVVENEDLEGQEATLILLNSHGEIALQTATVIGGGK